MFLERGGLFHRQIHLFRTGALREPRVQRGDGQRVHPDELRRIQTDGALLLLPGRRSTRSDADSGADNQRAAHGWAHVDAVFCSELLTLIAPVGGAFKHAYRGAVLVTDELAHGRAVVDALSRPVVKSELDPLGRRVAYGGPSATNNLDGPEHLYGGYLVRMGETFAYGVGAGKEYDPITGKVLPGITLFSF